MERTVILKGLSAVWPATQHYPSGLHLNDRIAVSFNDLPPAPIFQVASSFHFGDKNITGIMFQDNKHPTTLVHEWNIENPDSTPFDQVNHIGAQTIKPKDWDGGNILFWARDGKLYDRQIESEDVWIGVIGYRSRGSCLILDTTTHVAVRLRTEDELLTWITSAEREGNTPGQVGSRATKRFMELCKELGIVKEPVKKTLFERMKEAGADKAPPPRFDGRGPDSLPESKQVADDACVCVKVKSIEEWDSIASDLAFAYVGGSPSQTTTEARRAGILRFIKDMGLVSGIPIQSHLEEHVVKGKFVPMMSKEDVQVFVEGLVDALPNKMEMCNFTRLWDVVRGVTPLMLQYLGVYHKSTPVEDFAKRYNLSLEKAEEILAENSRFT